MRVVEVGDDEWAALKRRLVFRGPSALEGLYEPPVRIVHGCEYVVYDETEEDDGGEIEEDAGARADR